MLANSEGQKLIEHSIAVSDMAVSMAESIGVNDSELLNEIKNAGMFHDIGKASKDFQRYIKRKIKNETDDEESSIILHHELSWAFLVQKLCSCRHNLMLSAIYWHHAKPQDENYNFINHRSKILENVDLTSIDKIFNVLHPKCDLDFNTYIDFDDDDEVPDYFNSESGIGIPTKNAKILLVRSCIISADRYISSLSSSEVNDIANKKIDLFERIHSMIDGDLKSYTVPKHYDLNRFKLQEQIAEKASQNKVVQVNAPTALGKTLIGLLWGCKVGGRLIWVCPRNSIAIGVYDSIIKELKALEIDCSVELYLTNQVKKSNTDNCDDIGFTSDIVITNIDNLLSSYYHNWKAYRSFSLYGFNVVFDEFHEFASSDTGAIFSLFVTLMRSRNLLTTNSKTLLLSATPTVMNLLWSDDSNPTIILPDDKHHYPSAHNKKYEVNFIEDESQLQLNPSSLLIMNSIKQTQTKKVELGADWIAHGNYTDLDKNIIIESLIDRFGKEGVGVDNGENIVSSSIIQASMDISFNELVEHVCSPESSLQRIGRCNRWGKHDNSKITFLHFKDNSESSAIKIMYNNNWKETWFEFLKSNLNDGDMITLNDLYKLYNKFNIHYKNNPIALNNNQSENLYQYYKKKFVSSVEKQNLLFPIKKRPNGKNNSSGSSKNKNIRNLNGQSVYFIVKDNFSRWFDETEVMSEVLMTYNSKSDRYELNSSMYNNTKTMRAILQDVTEGGFVEYQKMINNKSRNKIPKDVKKWKYNARSKDKPIPDKSRIYHRKGQGNTFSDIGLGLIENNVYLDLKDNL